MHHAILQQAVSTILAWPLEGHERMARDAAMDTLLRAEVGGLFGGVSEGGKERLREILRAMAGFVKNADIEDVVSGGHWRPWGQMQHFMRFSGRTEADSVRLAVDSLWNYADEAVFWYRRGEAGRAKSSLGRALHGLQDSFSPAHVKREKDENGLLVIKGLFEYTSQDKAEHEEGDEGYRTGDGAESPYSELGKATVLASQMLLSYFVLRAVGRESEAAGTRQKLGDTYLREALP